MIAYHVKAQFIIDSIQYTRNIDFVNQIQLQIENENDTQTYESKCYGAQNGCANFENEQVSIANFQIFYNPETSRFNIQKCNLKIKLYTDQDIKFGGMACLDLANYLNFFNGNRSWHKLRAEKLKIHHCADEGAVINIRTSVNLVENCQEELLSLDHINTNISVSNNKNQYYEELLNKFYKENMVYRDQITLLQKEKIFNFLREKELQKSYQQKFKNQEQEIAKLSKKIGTMLKTYTAQNQSLNYDNVNLNKKIQELQNQNDLLTNQLKEKQEETNGLIKENCEIQNQVKLLQQENNAQKSMIQQLKEQQNTTEQNLKSLQEKCKNTTLKQITINQKSDSQISLSTATSDYENCSDEVEQYEENQVEQSIINSELNQILNSKSDSQKQQEMANYNNNNNNDQLDVLLKELKFPMVQVFDKIVIVLSQSIHFFKYGLFQTLYSILQKESKDRNSKQKQQQNILQCLENSNAVDIDIKINDCDDDNNNNNNPQQTCIQFFQNQQSQNLQKIENDSSETCI